MKSNMQTIEQEEEDVSLNKKRGRDTIGEDDSPIKKEGKKKNKEPNSEGKKEKFTKESDEIEQIIPTKEMETCDLIFKCICSLLDSKTNEKAEQQDVLSVLINKEITMSENIYWDSKENIIKHKFGTPITARKFIIYLCLILQNKYIKNNQDFENLRPLLPYFSGRPLVEYSFIEKDTILSHMKKDIILSFLLFNESSNLLTILSFTKNGLLLNLDSLKKNFNYGFSINIEFLTSIATSPLCIKEYVKLLAKEHITIEEKELQEEIKTIIQNIKVYESNLPSATYGMTLYNGAIVVNYIMVYDMLTNINACALFLGTFLHELLHYLKRYLNKKNDNYFYNTLENADIGDKFDKFLYGDRKYYFTKISLFLLDQKTYSLSRKEYNTKVKALLQSVSKSEKIKTQYGKEGYITSYRRHVCYKHSKFSNPKPKK